MDLEEQARLEGLLDLHDNVKIKNIIPWYIEEIHDHYRRGVRGRMSSFIEDFIVDRGNILDVDEDEEGRFTLTERKVLCFVLMKDTDTAWDTFNLILDSESCDQHEIFIEGRGENIEFESRYSGDGMNWSEKSYLKHVIPKKWKQRELDQLVKLGVNEETETLNYIRASMPQRRIYGKR